MRFGSPPEKRKYPGEAPRAAWRIVARALAAMLASLAVSATSLAQDSASPDGWDAGNTTTITRTAPEESPDQTRPARIRLVALLTADGQKIDKGLVWRVYQASETGGKRKLIGEHREPSPTLTLTPGEYIVSAAFGRAHLTRNLQVKSAQDAAGQPAIEQFVINAGGLRLTALVGGQPAPPNSVTYDIYSDRDQSDSRSLVMSDAKPGLVIRLNAGIYHIVSTYGDANAAVASDVTVEAGKLTEAQVSHSAAKATFKLVTRTGGEALSDTQWTVQTKDGRVVKDTMGALPTHTFAPGTYLAVARSGGKTFSSEFTLREGETAVVEVVTEPQGTR